MHGEEFPRLSSVTDEKLKREMWEELKIPWTYHSTGIEGNHLDLGNVRFLLLEGLTANGTLREYLEVAGHARALDLMRDIIDKGALTEDDLFVLHRAVQSETIFDATASAGEYKKVENWTFVRTDDGTLERHKFPLPEEIPALMRAWFRECNRLISLSGKNVSPEFVLSSHVALHLSFVSIHPFTDGNGRMARILANIPVLASEFPPIVVTREHRREYIDAIAKRQKEVGGPTPENMFVSGNASKRLGEMCESLFWEDSLAIVNEFVSRQKTLDARRAKNAIGMKNEQKR